MDYCMPGALYICGSWDSCYIYILRWIPVCQVVFIIHTFSETISRVDHSSVRWIFCFGMANSMVNPLIYGAFHLRRRHIGSGKRSANGASLSASSSPSFLSYLTDTAEGASDRHWLKARHINRLTYLLTYVLSLAVKQYTVRLSRSSTVLLLFFITPLRQHIHNTIIHSSSLDKSKVGLVWRVSPFLSCSSPPLPLILVYFSLKICHLVATISMTFLRINCPKFVGFAWRRHTKFQIGMAVALPVISLPAPLHSR